jgi:maltose-binding protein MalE
LLLWHAWPAPEHQVLATLIDRYNQSHAQTQVIPHAMPLSSLTAELRTATLVGGGPHLIILKSHTIGGLAQEDLLLPLDGHISTSTRNRLLPTALDGARVQTASGSHALYGLPLTLDTLVLYYNQANLNVPPRNTATLLRTARGLTDATTQPPVWGLAYTLSLDKTIGYLYAFGGRIFDEEGNLILGSTGRAGVEQWLEWLLQLHQDQQILAVNDGIIVDSALTSQEALMTIDWTHALPEYQALWGDQLGVAPLPVLSGPNRPPQPYVQSESISINARVVDTDEQQAVLDFAHYLLTEEAQTVLLAAGKQPAVRNLNPQDTSRAWELARTVQVQAQQGRAMPNSPVMNDIVLEELERMQLKVLRNLATPAEAVTAAEIALRQRLGLREETSDTNGE